MNLFLLVLKELLGVCDASYFLLPYATRSACLMLAAYLPIQSSAMCLLSSWNEYSLFLRLLFRITNTLSFSFTNLFINTLASFTIPSFSSFRGVNSPTIIFSRG